MFFQAKMKKVIYIYFKSTFLLSKKKKKQIYKALLGLTVFVSDGTVALI